MDLPSKVYGDIGVAKLIDNIVGHTDEDSSVRIRALEEIKTLADAGIKTVRAEASAKVDALFATPAVAPEAEA